MSFAREIVQDAAVGVGVAETPEGLSIIHKPGCAAAMWWRQPNSGFQTWLDALPADQLPRTRQVVTPDAVAATMHQACDFHRTPSEGHRDDFVEDITMLAELFGQIMGAPYLRIRLDVVTTNACRKFHLDAVTARLVCTYRGTGTQYGISTDGDEPQRVFTTPTGAPILLRGSLWPESPKSGLLHRSPPIEGTGQTRLVLVLDPLDRLEEEI